MNLNNQTDHFTDGQTVSQLQRIHSGANGQHPQIAVIIPCYNEEITIGKVIDDLRRELPEADIYVFDNCSTDSTAEMAREHRAKVLKEPRKGKGFVVESTFARVKADLYVLIDGDDTYPAESIHKLLEPVQAGDADMVVAARLSIYTHGAFPSFHMLGNR